MGLCSLRSEYVELDRRAHWVRAAAAMSADQVCRAVWPQGHGPAVCPALCYAALRVPRSH
eukprot:696029-Pleurochrysis_carterae.AAC.1